MKKDIVDFNRIISFLILFLILVVEAGFYSLNVFSGTTRLVCIFVFLSVLFIIRFSKLIFASAFFEKIKMTFPVFFFSLIIPIFYGRSNIKQMLIYIVPWIVGYFFTLVVSYHEFKSIFLRVVDFLSICSLIAILINLFFPEIFELFPLIVKKGTIYNNLIFSIVTNDTIFFRNYGIFWEPGAFSVYLCIALYFALFESKFNIWRIALLTFTVVSTLSTLGISCLFVLFGTYLFTSNTVTIKRIKIAIFFAGILAVILAFIFGSEFIYNVYGKLDITRLDVSVSTVDRINAVIYPFKAFISSPIIGVGYNYYVFIAERFCNGIATFTYLNWLCLYGVLGGVIPVFGCVQFFIQNNHKIIPKIGLFVFAILIFSTENYIYFALSFMLAFYGIEKFMDNRYAKKRR